jgi:vacuolar-type H+-ATPase subunit F/Vma7
MRIAILGEALLVQGYTLAGALGVEAEDAEAVVDAVRSLPDDVGVIVLTPAAAAVVDQHPDLLRNRLTAVMPS